MRGQLYFQAISLVGLGLALAGCAKSTPAPESPANVDLASEESKAGDESASASSGHSLDVGMEFKDKGDNENRRANREAPPTASWKPVEKDKAADPKKGTVTAAR
jgi:hypothetical protein